MRTVEEIENDIKECSATGTQKQLDEYWLEWFRTVAQGIEPERLREICAAEKDGRQPTLPCKIGDICYEIDPGHPGAIKHTVTGTTVYNRQADGTRYMTDFVNVITIETYAVAKDGCEWADQYTAKEWADAPKTRPEAEAALNAAHKPGGEQDA